MRENLDFYADVFGVSGAERRSRIEQLPAFAHLERFTGRRAGQLSGGMQKAGAGLHADSSHGRSRTLPGTMEAMAHGLQAGGV